MNQASKFIPCCFFHFLMCSRIIKYIYFIPNFAVPFWGLMDIMINDRYRNSPFIYEVCATCAKVLCGISVPKVP